MALFGKKCSVCGRKLPEKRKYKGVCDPCGMDYWRISKQLEDTIEIVEHTKNPVTGYDRCILGLELSDNFLPFVKAGISKFPRGKNLLEQKNFFVNVSKVFLNEIRRKNEKRKYEKKIGLPDLMEYKRLSRITNSQLAPGCCKACCRVNGELNEAGYCRRCLVQATAITLEDFKKMADDGLFPEITPESAWESMMSAGEAAILHYTEIKLDRSKKAK